MNLPAFDSFAPNESPVRLTHRELEILVSITEGHSNNEVGDLLFISRRTVEFHLRKIYSKLEVHNRLKAYHKATELGLIPRSNL